jgi:DNA polymerase
MGESDLVLDSMPVDDVLRLLGDRRPARDAAPAAAGDWRETLKSVGADAPANDGAPAATVVPRSVPSVNSEARSDSVRGSKAASPTEPGQAIVVGSATREFMGGPLAALDSLEAVARHIAACTACSLAKTARNHVPGEGSPTAGFVVVGEAPGEKEDELGRPFVGRSGELLTKILEAVHFKREDVFICNVLKHRPPGNRNPTPDEIKVCSPYLLRQLELLQPRVILALGTFASQTLLQTTQPIGKLRGLVHRFHGVPLIVTYHPAALLRNPAWKRPTWEDVQLARRIFDSVVQA